ncbi:MAG: hypothetical protein AAB558_01915 [Patescibacteria group bacterium]
MAGPQFLNPKTAGGSPIKPRLLMREKKPQPDAIILISAICNGLSILGIAAQAFVRSSLTLYIVAGSLFLFGGITGCLAGVVGVRHARQAGRSGAKLGAYSAGLGLLLALIAYASFMLQLNNFSQQL